MPGKRQSNPSRILSKAKLFESWEQAKRNGKLSNFPGCDGVAGKDFSKNLHQNLEFISDQISKGMYVFKPLEICWLPKRDNPKKERLICIPTVADRLVQRTIGAYLEKSDRLKISNSVSFGFQQCKSVSSAVDRAVRYRNEELRWVVKTDICSFFDRIPRPSIVRDLKNRVPDSLYPLLQQIVSCEAFPRTKLDARKLKEKGIVGGVGLRQGMPLSPMLSNFALRKFDEKVERSGLSMVRYADDIACFCRTKAEAEATHESIRQWLGEMGYEIPELVEQTKTKIVAPNEAFEFLGYDIEFDPRVSRYQVSISKLVHNRVHESFKKLASMSTCREEKWTFADVVRSLNSKQIAYTNSYALASNIDDLKRCMKNWHRDALHSLLGELFGERIVSKLTTEKLKFLGLKIVD